MSAVTSSRDWTGTGVRGLLRPAAHTTYEKIFGTVYVGLMTNLLLTVALAPLLTALAIVRNPFASWPFFVALSCLCAPALAGAFACFAQLGHGSTEVLRPFWTTYRRLFVQAATVWAAGAAVVSLLAVDAVVVARWPWGPALVPFFVTASALVVTLVLAVIVLLVELPPERAGRLRDLVRSCLYLAARRWYLAVVNVVVLGLAVTVVLAKPVIGLLVACAPLLYVVWSNTRYLVVPPGEESHASTVVDAPAGARDGRAPVGRGRDVQYHPAARG